MIFNVILSVLTLEISSRALQKYYYIRLLCHKTPLSSETEGKILTYSDKRKCS